MASVKHDPINGVSRIRGSWILKATHGAAFLLGVVVWYALPNERAPDVAKQNEVIQRVRRREPAAQATAWIDAALARMRSEQQPVKPENDRPPTIEQFLKERRKESEEDWQLRNENIDQIIASARSMRGFADPAAALAEQCKNNQEIDDLAIFQNWLDKDPDAALAEMSRNWSLLDRDDLPALLERKFGIEWVKAMIVNEAAPYRLRSVLARELGWQAAHGVGLVGFLQWYHAISDPILKTRMAMEFTDRWPLDEPESVARILGSEAPKELREMLVDRWTGGPFGPNSGEVVWLKDLYPRMGLGEFEYSGQQFSGMCGMAMMSGGVDMEASIKRWEARQQMNFDGIVEDCLKEGKSQEESLDQAIRIKVDQALSEGPDLIELFGEGQLTRAEFVAELRRKIPELDVHLDAFERQAWQMTAWVADPQEVAQWATELSQRGDMDELITQAFDSSSLYGDPRIPLRLERYRIVSRAIKEERSRGFFLSHAAWEWGRWQAVSPTTAESWLDRLPKTEPMYDVIHEKDQEERRRKENS